MSKRQDRRVKRRHLRALPPNPKTDPIAIGAGVVIVSFFEPIPELTMCHYCDRVATTRDHIVPKAKRGTDAWWNLVPACEPCNRKKTDNDTTCHCAFCSRAVFLFELGHMRPQGSPRAAYFEKPLPAKKKPKPPRKVIVVHESGKTTKKRLGPFDVKAAPLPDDLSIEAFEADRFGATPSHPPVPPSFDGSV
ncbi:HNH endonuclease [Microbacterium phage Magritte]|nr:HNH endonuclease [Microbacterium phage Magritte]